MSKPDPVTRAWKLNGWFAALMAFSVPPLMPPGLHQRLALGLGLALIGINLVDMAAATRRVFLGCCVGMLVLSCAFANLVSVFAWQMFLYFACLAICIRLLYVAGCRAWDKQVANSDEEG